MPTIGILQVLTTVALVSMRVVILDEGSRPPDEVQAHEVTPVVGMLTLLKSRQRTGRTLVATKEFSFRHVAEISLRANTNVYVLLYEEAELI